MTAITDPKENDEKEKLFPQIGEYQRGEYEVTPIFSKDIAKLLIKESCTSANKNKYAKKVNGQLVNRHQYLLRCGQDLLQPGECAVVETSLDGWSTWSNNIGILFPTAAMFVPHHIANTFFDFGYNLAPSQDAYKRGIGLTYGAVAQPNFVKSKKARSGHASGRFPCPSYARYSFNDSTPPDATNTSLVESWIHNCRSWGSEDENGNVIQSYFDLPRELSMSELNALWNHGVDDNGGGKRQVPFWIMQATGAKYRSLAGWINSYEGEMANDTFEFTPLGFGSRRYGFVKGRLEGFSALNATVAAAAFLDANQTVFSNPAKKLGVGLLVHGFNVNWGPDIPNYNVSNLRRNIHRILPLPINTVDSMISTLQYWGSPPKADRLRSSFIRLTDGGNSDSTGAYGLIRRGVQTIVIADGGEDVDGVYGDLCKVKRALSANSKENPKITDQQLHLHVPGLSDFSTHCEDDGPKGSYRIHGKWEHKLPVLLGCISRLREDTRCVNKVEIQARIVVVKPRLDWNSRDDTMKLEKGRIGACVYEDTYYRTLDQKIDQSDKASEPCFEQGNPPNKMTEACVKAVPCEVTRLLAMYEGGIRRERPPKFPQTSTWVTTGNSSGTLFASYRDLGRHYVKSASYLIRAAMSNTPEDFDHALEAQAAAPYVRAVFAR